MRQDMEGVQRWATVRIQHFVDLLRKEQSEQSFESIISAIQRITETVESQVRTIKATSHKEIMK